MNKKIMNAALSTSGHYVDIDANTLYVTTTFNKKAEIYGTSECSKMDEILAMFPEMKIVVQSKARTNDIITYKMMKQFINIMPEAVANLAEFERVQKMSHAYPSAYKFVSEWFKEKFPHYGKLLVKDEKNNLVWDAVAMYQAAEEEKAQKDAAQGAEKTVRAPKLTLLENAG